MKTKQEIRKYYKQKRAALSEENIAELSIAIANQLLNLPIWEFSYFHTFLTIEKQNEVDTSYLLHILQGKDKNILVSSSNFRDMSMSHYLLTDHTKLKVNTYGIPEPVDAIEVAVERIEVVFVPLLACDLHGNRIGYGKGFYDRFLSTCKTDVIKVGLSFFEPLDKIAEISTHDQKINYLVTPYKIYHLL
ncbi:5-formyltetrahydrofolate cyclo-ligase [Aquimarina sp. ERC-38]|uniref:5-formyltetrahydrofolate cyclo-ligase n=1 Tax=Aquimarina sp. ERC-38 TaxID=2949996 RepID=UPI00224600F7|nr:5-formyltetrahydrofolate cyclo-ligase [Aquimarina sp. ERC-38]UZO82138.1 5-formyltetrahydrofolate cyclo-ligase [Aquimarina sp. ERC-38]